jgi:hypothetical protein
MRFTVSTQTIESLFLRFTSVDVFYFQSLHLVCAQLLAHLWHQMCRSTMVALVTEFVNGSQMNASIIQKDQCERCACKLLYTV